MKYLLITLFALLVVFGSTSADSLETTSNFLFQSEQERIFEGLINNTINSVTAWLAKYDPIEVGRLKGLVLWHLFLLEDLHIGGFSNVYASHIKLSRDKSWYIFELTLEEPHTYASVSHWNVNGLEFYGDGDIECDFRGVIYEISAKLNLSGRLSVKDIRIKTTMGPSDVSITGIYNDEDFSKEISAKINHFLNVTVNTVEFDDLISDIIQFIVNLILNR